MRNSIFIPVLDAPEDVFTCHGTLPGLSPVPQSMQQIRVLTGSLPDQFPALSYADLLKVNAKRIQNFGTGIGEAMLTWRDPEDEDHLHKMKVDLDELLSHDATRIFQHGETDFLLFDVGLSNGQRHYYGAFDLIIGGGLSDTTLWLAPVFSEREVTYATRSRFRYMIRFSDRNTWDSSSYIYTNPEVNRLVLVDGREMEYIPVPGGDWRFMDYVVDRYNGKVYAYSEKKIREALGTAELVTDQTNHRVLHLVGHVPVSPDVEVTMVPGHEYTINQRLLYLSAP